MKRVARILLWVLLVVPVSLQSEVLYLKDGSVLRGRVVRMDTDTLHFETSFGSKLALSRSSVLRIELDESRIHAPEQPPVVPSANASAEPGTLSVSFEEFEVTSRVIVRRGGDRKAHENENVVEQALFVDGKKVHSVVDSLTDKTVRNGPETTLRNNAKPRDLDVAIAPGIYRCVVSFGNTRASAYLDSFDPAPLDKKLVLDAVRIESGRTTHVRVGLKRKWTGKTTLFKVE